MWHYTSYATSSKTYDIVCDIVRQNGKNLWKTYDIVRFLAISYIVHTMSYKKHTMSYTTSYTISYVKMARTCIFNVRYRISDVWYRIRYRIWYIHEQMLFSSHCNTSLYLQALFHLCLLKTAMTRIMYGIRMMKGIMLTSSLHHIAPSHTIPDHGIPLPVFWPLFRTGVSWTKWLWTTRFEDCQYQS